jgi:arsenate reductase
MNVKIYHNPRCSKSRQTLQLLQEQGIDPEVIEYLKSPPSAEELDDILQKLGMEPRELMRKNETYYKANGLDDETLDRQALINSMVNHPILIERPIVIANDKAAIGRPPEAALAIVIGAGKIN